MKPFNLQEALAGKKVLDKYERIGYYVGMIDNQYPYVFAFDNLEPTQQFVKLFNEHGQCVANPRYDTLSMATEKKTVWVKVYKSEHGTQNLFIVSNGHTDLNELNKTYNDNDNFIAIKSIEIEV